MSKTTFSTKERILYQAIDTFGFDGMIDKTIQKAAALIQNALIYKHSPKRDKAVCERSALLVSIADVRLMLDALLLMVDDTGYFEDVALEFLRQEIVRETE